MSPAHILKHRFPLAPMDGFTQSLFRRFMRHLGAGFLVSEFVPAQDIANESRKIREKTVFREEERPFGIQIYGNDHATLVDGARAVEQHGCDFVDFNFGCPVQAIVSKGKGAAWLRKPMEMFRLLDEVKKTVRIPVSVKIRTGFDRENVDEVMCAARDAGVDWVVIHGRTRADAYRAPINWELLSRTRATYAVPVIPSGDMHSAEGAHRLMSEHGFTNVMIGRGALLDPHIFLKLRRLCGEDIAVPPLWKTFSLFSQMLCDEIVDTNARALQLAKIAVHWAAGYPGAREYRIQLFAHARQGDWQGAYAAVGEMIAQTTPLTRDHVQGFLMAGHG